MPPGTEKAIEAAAATHDWLISVVTLFVVTFLIVFAIAARWYVNNWRRESDTNAKTASDSIAANAKLVAQYTDASEKRELRMGERITALENENRKTLLTMNAQSVSALTDSTNAIRTINATLIELVRETRRQTGEISRAAGEAKHAADTISDSAIRRKVSDEGDIHE